MTEHDVRLAARELVASSFEVLREQNVIPRPRWSAHMRVSHDYWGPDLMFLPAFKRFEEVLTTNYPDRFEDRIRPFDEYQDLPNSSAFHLIEAAVAELTIREEVFDAASPVVNGCIDELVASLAEDSFEVVCLWVV